jgi:hypothetical protein
MKPSLQFTQINRRGEVRSSVQRASAQPKTDYHYQAPFADFSRGSNGKGKPSFRGISAGYFKNEARTGFAVEASMFGVIVLITAVPVFQALRGFADLVYSGL